MDFKLFEKLHAEGLITDTSFQKIKTRSSSRLFSVHWELKTILYLGVLLFTTGAGVLVYKNIDTIGHQVILLIIALVSAAGFFYCYKKKYPFTWGKVVSPNSFFDYILLLACLTFITFIGYLQFQYNVFGNRYGLATFIPMSVLFFSAYYFDHVGILSLAITNLAAWVGITITPAKILQANDFNSTTITLTGFVLGLMLVAAGSVTKNKRIKLHFEFTWTNFGMHILFISCLAAMFQFEKLHLIWFLVLIGISYFFYTKAVQERSFYFLLFLSLYLYIGLSHVVIRFLSWSGLYAGFLYFISSAIGLAFFLIKMNKKFKTA